MKFRTVLEQAGKTATGIHVPDEVVEGLGAGKRPPVRVTINGYTYRSTVASMGGRFLVGVNAQNREAAGVAAGTRSTSRSSSTRRLARWRSRPTSRRR